MALNRDKSIEERKQEIDEELEEYSSRGIVSPNALKAARWLSRILWLAMSALVVVMLYQLNTRVPEADYKKLEKQAGEIQAERKRLESELDVLKGQISAEALRLGVVSVENVSDADKMEVLRGIIDEARRARSREDSDALVIAGLASWRAMQEQNAGVPAEEYARAEKEKKAVALARFALEASAERAEFFRGVAIATDAAMAERVIAIRWLAANGRDEASRMVLTQLAQDPRPLIAAEAKKAQ
ncbi:MAG: hypothetical protein KBG84_08595 [Planctomycetes bacterium]|nr:hypothetical protein [Planctomycetota bacterium]